MESDQLERIKALQEIDPAVATHLNALLVPERKQGERRELRYFVLGLVASAVVELVFEIPQVSSALAAMVAS